MNPNIRPNLLNSRDHQEADKYRETIHVKSDADRADQERFNSWVDIQRQLGRITQVESEWAKHLKVRECKDVKGQ